MKYQQPFGISDPNAPYINGNPSTGTMGSIPPAASIEHPQREIVNFINDTQGIVPSELDLHQLAKAIQSGGVNYGDDLGTPNQLVVNLGVVPAALRKGLHVYTIIANDNYVGGPSTLNVNSLGPKPIKHLDHSDLAQGELKTGTLALFVYDGVNWQWVSSPFVGVVQGSLDANRAYYINPVTGSDTANDGLTVATPFKTIQRAVNASIVVNLNGYNISIYCADGTYPDRNTILYPLNGNGTVHIIGNTANPQQCIMAPASGTCIRWGSIFPTSGWFIRGFRMTSPTDDPSPGYQGMGLYGGYGALGVQDMEWGPCRYAHIAVSSSCKITMGGVPAIWRITGGAEFHIVMGGACELLNYQPNLVIQNNPLFSSYFVEATSLAFMGMRWNSITGTARGSRYWVDLNGIINTGGMGVGYLPGDSAGYAMTGGQYV